jgi:hypothetical protein
VRAHNLLDGLGGLVGVIEWDGRYVVVEDVCLDDTVEELTADETKFTVDSGSGSTGKVPCL